MTTARRSSLAAILVLAVASSGAAGDVDSLLLAERAHSILLKHCAECHSGTNARGGLKGLDHDHLGKFLTKGDPDASDLLQLVECGSEPRGTRPKVPAGDVKVLRDWIAGGTPPFAKETSEAYAQLQILLDVQSADRRPDLGRERYVTFNHLLGTAGASPELFRDALTAAINLTSWQKGIVKPTAIEPTGSVFRINLRDLGWDATPYRPGSNTNLYDLVLLEYPFGAVPPAQHVVYKDLDQEYVQKAGLIRPVAFVRGDWFVSAIGQPPLYEDLLRLPVTLPDLEKKLGLKPNPRQTAGVAKSRVFKYPRILERRSADDIPFWRTFDFHQTKELTEAAKQGLGGEALFVLPNGLPGFFVAGADGHRLPETPIDLLSEETRKAGPLRSGFACVRCHAAGLKDFSDDPALNKLAGAVAGDNHRFADAIAKLPGKVLDPIAMFPERVMARTPSRDEKLIPPLDGLTHTEVRRTKSLNVELASFNKDGEKATVFKQNEEMYLVVDNSAGDADVWVEFISISRSGGISLIPLEGKEPQVLLPKGKKLRFPGEKNISVEMDLGKNAAVVFISDKKFPPGVVLNRNPADGLDYVADRFKHPFQTTQEQAAFREVEKRTVVIETRAK
jgi:mono/diheme cytochrome c family protein